MPLRWIRGHNSFVESLFQALRVGPQARPPQIVAQANNLRLQLSAGHELRIGWHPLTTQSITESSTLLREDAARAEELLLAHWPVVKEPTLDPPCDGSSDEESSVSVQSFAEQIQLPALVPFTRPAWFALAAPSADIIPLPTWHQLGISESAPLDHDLTDGVGIQNDSR